MHLEGAMADGRMGCELAVLAALCTVVFFFPVAQGPYSVVHGPVTTLSSIRARLGLWLEMALAAWQLLDYRAPAFYFASLRAPTAVPQPTSFPHEQTSVLRC